MPVTTAAPEVQSACVGMVESETVHPSKETYAAVKIQNCFRGQQARADFAWALMA